jgi:hypothetical protein
VRYVHEYGASSSVFTSVPSIRNSTLLIPVAALAVASRGSSAPDTVAPAVGRRSVTTGWVDTTVPAFTVMRLTAVEPARS